MELAERLIGKGFERPDLRPGGQPGPAGRGEPRVRSSRSCRTCGRLLAAAPADALRRQRHWPSCRRASRPSLEPRCSPTPPPRHLIDLMPAGSAPAVEALPGYEGLGW